MMIPTLKKWDIDFSILDKEDCVCAALCRHLKVGDFKSGDDIDALMNNCGVITYDLEAISLEGLKKLSQKGIELRPSLSVMETIQDKGKQKTFFKEEGIPTSDFKLVDDNFDQLPEGFIKLRRDGYDGKGVFSWTPGQDYPDAFKKPIVWEEKIKVEKEISVLVVRDHQGIIKTYEPVDMVFNSELNLIDYTLFPSSINESLKAKASELAIKLADKLDLVGLMAVEMFVVNNDLLINELAPRPHNSGHHTIESHAVSQFENHLRAVLSYPLGVTKPLVNAALTFNLLGIENGVTYYEGLEELLAEPDVYVHLYGKKQVRRGRKMGHVTITGTSAADVVRIYKKIKDKLIVTKKG